MTAKRSSQRLTSLQASGLRRLAFRSQSADLSFSIRISSSSRVISVIPPRITFTRQHCSSHKISLCLLGDSRASSSEIHTFPKISSYLRPRPVQVKSSYIRSHSFVIRLYNYSREYLFVSKAMSSIMLHSSLSARTRLAGPVCPYCGCRGNVIGCRRICGRHPRSQEEKNGKDQNEPGELEGHGESKCSKRHCKSFGRNERSNENKIIMLAILHLQTKRLVADRERANEADLHFLRFSSPTLTSPCAPLRALLARHLLLALLSR
jgi:hypothetical protein